MLAIRPIHPGDAEPASAAVAAALGVSGYDELPHLALTRALAGDSDESLGLACVEDARLVGVVLHGLVAGSAGAAKLHLIAVDAASRRRGIATRLLAAAIDDLRARGARLLVAEVPDEEVARAGLALLARAEFSIEGRVPDFHRDGVDLLLLRRDV